MLDYISNNKEWIFSGIGIVLVNIILLAIKNLKKHNDRHDLIAQLNNTNKIIITLIFLVVLIQAYIWHTQPCVHALRLASGPAGGTFSDFASELKHSLWSEKIAIVETNTDGSLENLRRLCKERGSRDSVDIALAHNDILPNSKPIPKDFCFEKIRAIAHVYDALLFAVIKNDKDFDDINNIDDDILNHKGTLEVFAGGEESGTRSIFNRIIPENTRNIHFFKASSFVEAANLLGEKIDIFVFLVEQNADVIKMLKDKGDKVRFIGIKDANRIVSGTRLKEGVYLVKNHQPIATIKVSEYLFCWRASKIDQFSGLMSAGN